MTDLRSKSVVADLVISGGNHDRLAKLEYIMSS